MTKPRQGLTKVLVALLLEVTGGVYSLADFQGMLICTVNNRVILWSWAPAEKKLNFVAAHSANVIAIIARPVDDYIFVGDLMRSATMLQFRKGEDSIQELARDFCSGWVTSLAVLSPRHVLCADDRSK